MDRMRARGKPMVKMMDYTKGGLHEGDDDYKDPVNALHLGWDHHFFSTDPNKAKSSLSGNRDALISMDPKLRTKGDDAIMQHKKLGGAKLEEAWAKKAGIDFTTDEFKAGQKNDDKANE